MTDTRTESHVDFQAERVRAPTLHHINLKTTRLQEMIDWYGQVIGSRPNFEWPGGAFLTNDGANHRVALLTLPAFCDDAERMVHSGMHHVAFEYESLDDLLASYLRLKDVGILPGVCLDHGLTTSFYYPDPDGNFVELQADNYGDWEASTAFIRSDPRFAEDPIGRPLDPEQMVAARRAGVSPEELQERGYRGEYMPSDPPDLGLPV